MAVDYLILKDCKVKEQLAPDQLVATIKDRNRAYQVRDMLANSGKSQVEIDNFEFTFQKLTPNGIENSKHKIPDIVANTSILDTLSPICNDCPIANGKSFGCLGAVNYPISAKCEKWLAKVASDSYKKGEEYSLMITFILDKNVNGNITADSRNQGETFFELRKPAEIILSKGLFSKKSINTNQILDMLFGYNVMQSTHMNHMLMLFGGIYLSETKPNDRPSTFNSEQNKYMYLGLDLPKDSDNSITNFYNLFHQMFLALTNGCDVSFDR